MTNERMMPQTIAGTTAKIEGTIPLRTIQETIEETIPVRTIQETIAETTRATKAETTVATTADRFVETPRTLSDLLRPKDEKDFLEHIFGTRFQHQPGKRGRFAGLLPWPILNRILRQHRLEPPRLRLVKNGKAVPPDSYLTFSYGRGRGSNRTPHLRVPKLTRQLREGATLILDAVDELYEPITKLCSDLENRFRVRVQANMYAGWRTSRGFDCHWDDHDVFILQIAGRKHWKIYGITREFPLARDAEPALEPPATAIWNGFLEDGDLLYIPRGCWHEAIPLDEPTLHLTVGIHNITGADLLSWFIDQLRTHKEVRQDVPRFTTPQERTSWMNALGKILRESWTPQVLDRYLNYLNGLGESRPDIGLPWSAMPEVLPAGEDFEITWAARRDLKVNSNGGGTIEFACNGKCYTFAAKAAPVLKQLQEASHLSLRDICSAVADELTTQTVRKFIRELVVEGLVSIHTEA